MHEDKKAALTEGLFHPEEQFMRRWDLWMVALLFFVALITPYEIALLETSLNLLFFVNRFIDLFFCFDIFINSRLCFVDVMTDLYVYDKEPILRRYLFGWFCFDVVATIPWDLVSFYLDSTSMSKMQMFRVAKLFRLVKLAKVVRASQIIRRWETELDISYAMMGLYKFAFACMSVAHWGACFWILAATIAEESDENNWIRVQELTEATNGSVYIASLYWSTMTATTIGYGDIYPESDNERIAAIICMLFGAAIYAYTVGSICGLIASMDERTTEYHATMDNLNMYMKEMRLPLEMRKRLRVYFMHTQNLQFESHRQKLRELMSPGIRSELAMHCHSEWLSSIPFLIGCPEDEKLELTIALSTQLTYSSFPANEMIIRYGEETKNMYVIQRGLIARTGNILSKGKFCGEDIILSAGKRLYHANSLTFVDVLVLRRTQLQDVLQNGTYPKTRKFIRRCAIRLAVRRAFIEYAKYIKKEEKKGVIIGDKVDMLLQYYRNIRGNEAKDDEGKKQMVDAFDNINNSIKDLSDKIEKVSGSSKSRPQGGPQGETQPANNERLDTLQNQQDYLSSEMTIIKQGIQQIIGTLVMQGQQMQQMQMLMQPRPVPGSIQRSGSVGTLHQQHMQPLSVQRSGSLLNGGLGR